MSSFPQILRTTKSAYFRPTKQGGIYALDIKPTSTCSTIQPEQYFTAKQNKLADSAIETNNTHQNRHQRNLSLANFARNALSSQTQRRPLSRAMESRLSTREVKKQTKNYGKQKLSSYAVAQSVQTKCEQAESFCHRINYCLQVARTLDQQFFGVVVMRHETQAKIKRLYDQMDDEFRKVRTEVEVQFEKLRKVVSALRRSCLMGLKVNKLETSKLQEQFKDITATANSLDNRGYKMFQACLNQL